MVLIYILIGAGIGLTLLRMVMLIMVRINIKMFNQMVIKLINAGNTDRAIKLCNAATRSAYAEATKKMLEQAQEMGTGVKEMGATKRLLDAFNDDLDARFAKLHKSDWLASLGVLLAVAGAALSLGAEDAPLLPLLGPVVALGLTFRTRSFLKKELLVGREAGTAVAEAYVEAAKTRAA